MTERETEIANRELTCAVAEAAMRFVEATGGIHAEEIKLPIARPLDFRRDVRRAFAVRDQAVLA